MMIKKVKNSISEKILPIKTFLVRHLFVDSVIQRWVVSMFHRMYVALPEQTISNTHWMGIQAVKCPLDLWIYQEIIHDIQPDVIIETGTYAGGSALFLAHMCDLIGNGRVISIDIDTDEKWPQHPRLQYIQGDSTSLTVLNQVQDAIQNSDTVLIALDSDHSKTHVLREMEAYSPLITSGSYLIVEDTHVNGHPIRPEHGDGPMEAVEEFLRHSSRFVVDHSKEKYFLTFNRNGYLKCL